MKFKNKIFTLALFLVLALVLSGCTDSGQQDIQAPEASAAASETESPAEEVIEDILESSEEAISEPVSQAEPEDTRDTLETDSSAQSGETSSGSSAETITDAGPAESGNLPSAPVTEPSQSSAKTETVQAAEIPAQAPSVEKTEAPAPNVAEEPETVTEAPEPVETEPETPKTIYDYAFDASAIRSELIALGQSMGLTHVTEDDGIPCTPDTCSWASPVTASESFQGDKLKRALRDYVTSMPSLLASYGGTEISYFTIYVQENGGGSYTFYFLY